MQWERAIVGGIVIALSGTASADQLLQFDIDGLSASSASPFSDTYSGDFSVLSTGDADSNAKILDMLINGNNQSTGGAAFGDFFFELNITFAAGKISSGDVTIRVNASGSENIYTATLSPSDTVSIQDVGGLGIIYNIGGLTFDGMFSDAAGTILGVDITPWGSVQPVSGFFSEIAFTPDGLNSDSNTDVDVFVSVPLPGAAGLAGIGLLGLVARRWR